MRKLSKAFRTLVWVDVDEYDVFSREPYNLSVKCGNFIRSLATWTHVALGKQNPYILLPVQKPIGIFQTFTGSPGAG